MQILHFDAQHGKNIAAYGSNNLVITRLVDNTPNSFVVCMYLQAGGIVGYHQATQNQLFLVVQGSGWVRGEAPERVLITAGQAAFWQAGEMHESGTDEGMTAVVIEGEGLQPAAALFN